MTLAPPPSSGPEGLSFHSEFSEDGSWMLVKWNHFLCLTGGKSTMTSAKKVAEKQHNPMDSICRKLWAIQKREDISDPIQQIIKYQSSSFYSPQTNPKKDFEEVLKKMMDEHIPLLNMLFFSPEKDGTFASQSQIVSPRTPFISHISSPENATYSLILTSSENISRLRSQSSQNYTSLTQQITKRELFANKDFTNYCSGNDFSTLALDFDSTSDQSSEFLTQDSVVKKIISEWRGVETRNWRWQGRCNL